MRKLTTGRRERVLFCDKFKQLPEKLLYIYEAIMIYNPCHHPSASPRLRMIVIMNVII